MLRISVTCSVLKLTKSSDVNEEQSLNMLPIPVTFSVLKLDKLSDVNEEQ